MGQRPVDAQGAGPLSPRARIGWLAAASLALLYLTTSAIVLVNSIGNATGALWLPSLPDTYYRFERGLYLPFRPWFSLLRRFQDRADVGFAAWALLCRGPIVAGATVVIWFAARALRRTGRREPASG